MAIPEIMALAVVVIIAVLSAVFIELGSEPAINFYEIEAILKDVLEHRGYDKGPKMEWLNKQLLYCYKYEKVKTYKKIIKRLNKLEAEYDLKERQERERKILEDE